MLNYPMTCPIMCVLMYMRCARDIFRCAGLFPVSHVLYLCSARLTFNCGRSQNDRVRFFGLDRCDPYVHPEAFCPQSWPCAPTHIPGTPRIYELAISTEHVEERSLCHRGCPLNRTLRRLLLRLSVCNPSTHHHSCHSVRPRPRGVT